MKLIAPVGRARALALAALALLGLAALLLGGCGGGGSSASPVTSVSVRYYYVSDSGVLPIAATVGDRVQLLAAGNTASGDQEQLTDGVTWHSTNAAVAAVDAGAWLTAKSPGTTEISLSWSTFTSPTLKVTVSAAGPTPTATYYPFVAGNQWVYTGTEVAPASAAAATTLTIIAADQVVLEGLVWWELQINYTDGTTGTMYLRHDATGLREVDYQTSGSSTVPLYTYRLQAPFTAGQHWTDPADPAVHYWDLQATAATVTVPAGTYHNCLQVREHDVTTAGTAFYTTVWFAPAVGLVQTETDTIGTGGVLTLTQQQKLLSSKLAAAAALSAGRGAAAAGRSIRPWVGPALFRP